MGGDEKRDILRQAYPFGLRLLEQDGHPHFQFRRFDCNGQSPAETRDESILDAGDLLRVGITSNDDLLVCFDQRIEGVEELLLGPVFATEKLDIVDQQKVKGVVVLLEPVKGFVLISTDYIRNILLGM